MIRCCARNQLARMFSRRSCFLKAMCSGVTGYLRFITLPSSTCDLVGTVARMQQIGTVSLMVRCDTGAIVAQMLRPLCTPRTSPSFPLSHSLPDTTHALDSATVTDSGGMRVRRRSDWFRIVCRLRSTNAHRGSRRTRVRWFPSMLFLSFTQHPKLKFPPVALSAADLD